MHATTPLVGIAALAFAIALHSPESSPPLTAQPLTALPIPDPSIEASCKPTGPIELLFEMTRDFGDGTVELELVIRARMELMELDWRLEMPYDVALLEGRRSASLSLARGEDITETMRVRLSSMADGRVVTAVARGVFEGSSSDGAVFPEPVVVQRSIRWGAVQPVGPVTTYLDPLTGEEVRMVDVPSVRTSATSRREGRSSR